MKRSLFTLCAMYLVSTFALASSLEGSNIPNGLATEQQINQLELALELESLQESLIDIERFQAANTQNIRVIKQKIDVSELVNVNLEQISAQYALQKSETEALQVNLAEKVAVISRLNIHTEQLESNTLLLEQSQSELQQQILDSKKTLNKLNIALLDKIEQANQNSEIRSSELAHGVSKNLLWTGAGFAFIFVLLLIILLIWRKKLATSNDAVERKIQSAKASLESEGLNLDNKLLEVLEKQLLIAKENKLTTQDSKTDKQDHSLTLKVADEITRMQKNLLRMEPGTKGLKAVGKGVERLRKNFIADGYEIVDLLNKPYDERMNMDVINFVDGPELKEDEKVIVKIVRPQVNFNGVLIQRAQVEVAVN